MEWKTKSFVYGNIEEIDFIIKIKKKIKKKKKATNLFPSLKLDDMVIYLFGHFTCSYLFISLSLIKIFHRSFPYSNLNNPYLNIVVKYIMQHTLYNIPG